MGKLKEKYPIIAESHFISSLEYGMAQIAEDILYDIIVFDKMQKEPWMKDVYQAFFDAYADFVKENPVLIIPKVKGEFSYTDIVTPQYYAGHWMGNSVTALGWEYYEIKPLVAEECIRPHTNSLLNVRKEDIQKEYARRVIRRIPIADRVIDDIDWSSDIEKSKKWYAEYTKVFPLPPLQELVGKSVQERIDRYLNNIKNCEKAIEEYRTEIEKLKSMLSLV